MWEDRSRRGAWYGRHGTKDFELPEAPTQGLSRAELSEVPRTVVAWNNAQVPNLGTDCAVPCPGHGPSPPAAGGAVSRDTILPQPRAGVEGAWDCGRDLWATLSPVAVGTAPNRGIGGWKALREPAPANNGSPLVPRLMEDPSPGQGEIGQCVRVERRWRP